jgi:hypothetical protein
MEDHVNQQGSDGNPQRGFGFRLQIGMSFIKSFINQLKVTDQELIDAGVISTSRARSRNWIEPEQTPGQYQTEMDDGRTSIE